MKIRVLFEILNVKQVQESNFELDNTLHLHFPEFIQVSMKCAGRELRVAEAAWLLWDPGFSSCSQFIPHHDFSSGLHTWKRLSKRSTIG